MTTILSGGAVVLADRVLDPGTVVVEAGRIVEVRPGHAPAGPGVIDVSGRVVVPGFIDVHVHGVEGQDTLDHRQRGRRDRAAPAPLWRHRVLPDHGGVRAGGVAAPARWHCGRAGDAGRGARARASRAPGEQLHRPGFPWRAAAGVPATPDPRGAGRARRPEAARFSGDDILAVIASARPQVGILTIAPEIDGHLDLIRDLVGHGHIVSLGHSGATFEQGLAGVDAGGRHATHLFNRMPPLSHRAPGLIGAVLSRPEVRAEIVCDGYHVHPVVARTAMAALGRERMMAITDGTAGSGLPVGSVVPLGSHTITVTEDACFLADGTLAGSRLTMDGAFRVLMSRMGASLVDAAYVCATTPARQLGLTRTGEIAVGMAADLAVLTTDFKVVATYVDGAIAGI